MDKIARWMNEPGLALGFYPDRETAARAARALRHAGFRRSAVLRRTQDGRVAVETNDVTPQKGALLAGGIGLLLGFLLDLASLPLALLTVAAVLAGWMTARRLDGTVDERLLAPLRRRVLHGEALVVVQTPEAKLSEAASALGRIGGAATFALRRTRDFAAGMPAEPWPKDASGARLAVHAARYAREFEVGRARRRAEPLLARLRRDREILDYVRRSLAEAVAMREGLTAGAEWLLDNAYLIQGQIAEIFRNLPQAYYRGLRSLANGPLAGTPRIFGLAMELVARSDGRLDRESILEFLRGYQSVKPLTLGELWATPLMLRLALVASLQNLSRRIHRRQILHEQADFWANRLLHAARQDPDRLLSTLAELAREHPQPPSAFAVRLLGHVHDEPAALAPLQTWLERKMDLSLAETLQQEQSRQAADQVSTGNAVNSLRFLARLPWREIFERVSLVEETLRTDPAGVYAGMDFATRDRYRHAVEEISRWARATEEDTARRAVELAGRHAGDARCGHVGYYLVAEGRRALEAAVGARPPLARRMLRRVLDRPAAYYLVAIGALTLAVLAALTAAGGTAALLLLLAVPPAGELAVQLVNHLVGRFVPPRVLPSLSFADGIPAACKTLVAVPMILLSMETIRDEVERLLVRYQANADENLLYALLADLPDASAPVASGDAELLRAAADGIAALNDRYGPRFFLFCRPRRWSESERCWMGWERKRGKLEELNRFLAGLGGEPDFLRVGKAEALAGVRYVITLDSDTVLPPDSARRLVEVIAHPLNRAVPTPDGRGTAAGYAIIQPRVCTSLPGAMATRFTMLFADPTGMNPYCHAISDVYQDLAGEGTYYGKAIYDVQAFHRILDRRFPESTVLSHDLLEGAYARTGLATEIELLDLCPETYRAYIRRQHRWIRGDWQIAPWLLPRAAGERNPLSLLNRWKILDNLRRSLVAPAALLLLMASWFAGGPPAVIPGLVAAVYLFPFLAALPGALGLLLGGSVPAWQEIARSLLKGLFLLSLLPHQALISADAVARVWYRRLVSRRHLLQWETAQATQLRCRNGGGGGRFLGILAAAGGTAAALAGVAALKGAAAGSAWPFAALWALSPLAVRWLDAGRPRPAPRSLAREDRRALRRIARKTWRYFDDFVNETANWLPPDNYQEALNVKVAQRTSPTNIGMWLLSALAAHDLGYLAPARLLDLLERTMSSIDRLELYEGHLLNWYDTSTREPLRPRYVSTVDSGNLLACLWTLARGLSGVVREPLAGPAARDGLADGLALLDEALAASALPASTAQALAAARVWASGKSPGLAAWIADLERAHDGAREFLRARLEDESTPQEVLYWARKLEETLGAWRSMAESCLGWAKVLAAKGEDELAPLGKEFLEARRRLLAGPAPSIAALADGGLIPVMPAENSGPPGGPEGSLRAWLDELRESFARSAAAAAALAARLAALIRRIDRLADGMGMSFLYDPARRLFPIGFNVDGRRLDTSYYDLLASEARLASFIAVARGDVPLEHWGALSRPFGVRGGRPALLSWNGTMFEYLMPALLTKSFPGSLLDEAARTAVSFQVRYAARRGIPWGISEAAFSALDSHRVYQYRAFGVPWLGLKRGLEDDLVVAPYATALALGVDREAAVANLRRLGRAGLEGRYGFYEAIDYTRARRPEGERGVVIYAFMAHHQGMTLLALDNALHNGIMQARFHADPRVRATEPLLYERPPANPPITRAPGGEGPAPPRLSPIVAPRADGQFASPHTPYPRAHLLSNGDLTVMVTNAGGGFIRWREMDLTRWRADTTKDEWGTFIYLKDLRTGAVWSAAYQPLGQTGRHYAANFSVDRAEFRRRDHGIECLTEIAVSPEDDAEVRRLTLVNLTGQRRELEITSFMELALAPHAADRAHPAFNKLFVATEALPEKRALIAWRRRRTPEEQPFWAGHVLAMENETGSPVQFETDRRRFLGRGGCARRPAALSAGLSGTAGFVLDPVFSLRCRVAIEPGQSTRLAFVTVAGESRRTVLDLVGKYGNPGAARDALEMAWTRAQLELRHLGIEAEDARSYQELASHALYPNPRLRPTAERLRRNALGQSRLWAYGISGDLPILTISVNDPKELRFAREMLIAHTYLRLKGLKADLVILNGEAPTYGQPLQEELRRLIAAHSLHTGVDRPGGIFLRAAAQMPEEDLTLILAVSRAVLVAARGPLAQQLTAADSGELPPRLKPNRRLAEEPSAPLPFLELPYFNGLGGFTPDGREYAIYLGPGVHTPAPWVNIIANPDFGTLVSQDGTGFTWYGNSQTNRLSPWTNDPVADPSTDAVYIRDDETGVFWSPTPAPVREQDAYRARHGQGYTVFEHNSHAIEQELTVFVPVDDEGGAPIRLQRLRLINRSSRPRRLSVWAYTEWTLGVDREETQPHLVTRWDRESQVLLARNAYHPDYPRRVAFTAMSPPAESYTADRTEFLGRNGTPAHPAALNRRHLGGRTGPGLDACSAQQVTVELEPGGAAEVVILLGQGADVDEVRRLVRYYRDPFRVQEAFEAVRAFWDGLLGTVQVRTPYLAVNFLLNRWLLYQTLSCRIWARSSLYQSGGAYGFRDQLQDVLALVHTAPGIARKHLLRAAGRQFLEGDVQHWWHPPAGGGVRTRHADDPLWLPYAAARYVEVTGDLGVLEERVPFLEGRPLGEEESEAYLVPATSMEDGTLLEHCRRAIERGSACGPHGLPLIGAGDWNDGLNRVGRAGRGESVWLAWFSRAVLRDFARLCARIGREDLAREYRARAEKLAERIEAEAWDGDWYRRAFYDDGTPLGTGADAEARLDLLPQAWAALAGAAAAPRTTRALAAAAEHLVRPDDGLVALFAPPFDETPRDPGYIKSYPPGVRENGGQYTHAAIWLAMAHARRGEGGKAAAILRLLNPVEHARQPAEAERFRVEPYAVAADVYALPGRVGQGGWSWYTGSSGWMYRVWLEEVLGVQRTGDRLRLNPSVPADWERYEVSYRYGETVYEIAVENPDHVEHGVVLVELDGEAAAGGEIALRDDGGTHRVRVRMGAEASRADEDALPVENGGRQDTPHPLAPVPSLNRRNGFEH